MKTKLTRLFVALAWLALPALVQAQFTFTTNNGAITITGYNTAAGLHVVIPAATNGYPVTSIGPDAFSGSRVTSVTIPNSVTNIGGYAFYPCTSLTNISVAAANPIYSSMNGVLFDKAQATLLQFPGGLGGSYTIPNSVASIGGSAFLYCTGLTSVTIPASVTNIGGGAFYDCGLTSVFIPASVTSIGWGAFTSCNSLTSITVDASNPAYGSMNGVLSDKAQATLLQFPGGLGGSYTIPNSVTSIGISAFSACINLTGVTIPSNVTNIGVFAFLDCTSLTSVSIPSSVTSIGRDAFGFCSSLTSVAIPDSVTSIGSYAFEYCTILTTVTIPSSVTNIGVQAFYNCTILTSAYFLGNAPPDDGSAFNGDSNDPATVYYLPGTTGWGSTFGGVPAVLWNPQATAMSVTGGQFGFILTGPTNAVIVVEACTNLAHPVWLPVSTNTLSGFGTSAFSDPTGYPMRYYRFRSP